MANLGDLKIRLADYLIRNNMDHQLSFFISEGQKALENALLVMDQQRSCTIMPPELLKEQDDEVEPIAAAAPVVIPAGSTSFAVPTDYLMTSALRINDGTVQYRPMSRLSYASLQERMPGDMTSVARPKHFSRRGQLFVFSHLTDIEYTLDHSYYAREPTLILTESNNYWSNQHEGTLIMFALVESIPFLGDDPRGKVWGNAAQIGLRSIATAIEATETSGESAFFVPNAQEFE